MARKKKKDEVENYFNNVANYQTEAEARAVTPEGVKVFCAFDELVPIGKVVPNPGNPNTHHLSRSHCWLPLSRGRDGGNLLQ